MHSATELIAHLAPTAGAEEMNAIVQACVVEGRGIFIASLQATLRRQRLQVPFLAHDLIAELEGRTAFIPLDG